MHRVLSLLVLSFAILALQMRGAEAGRSSASAGAHGTPFHGFHQFHFGAFGHFHRFGPSDRFGAAPFLAPTLSDWWDWSSSSVAGGASGLIVIINMGSPPPPSPPPGDMAATKTVENGVTVFRGPSRQ